MRERERGDRFRDCKLYMMSRKKEAEEGGKTDRGGERDRWRERGRER